jgi:hypothetical protein
LIDIGFTGTRQGMTKAQLRTLWLVFKRVIDGESPDGEGDYSYDRDVMVRHGDCVGADAECHTLALASGFEVTTHPPLDPRYWARCQYAAEVKTRDEYIARNHAIVNESKWLISCPKEMTEPTDRRGGGTWATVRYGAGELAKKPPGGARKVLVILPDGSEIRRK